MKMKQIKTKKGTFEVRYVYTNSETKKDIIVVNADCFGGKFGDEIKIEELNII
jgi:hypothetical protein